MREGEGTIFISLLISFVLKATGTLVESQEESHGGIFLKRQTCALTCCP